MIPDIDRLIEHVLFVSETIAPSRKPRRWNLEEDDFLRKSMAFLTEIEIGNVLGRTAQAVRLHRVHLRLDASSKTSGWISALGAARLLGFGDARYVSTWVKRGMVLGHVLSEKRKICMVNLVSLHRFVLHPMNWPWFDVEAVQDLHLKRLLERQRQRWGDEWLTAKQAARLLGWDPKKVNHAVRMGRIEAVHIPNKSGRYGDRPGWAYYFVRRSQVEQLRAYAPGEARRQSTPAAIEWIRKAMGMGWSVKAIARSMKKNPQTVRSWIGNYGLTKE